MNEHYQFRYPLTRLFSQPHMLLLVYFEKREVRKIYLSELRSSLLLWRTHLFLFFYSTPFKEPGFVLLSVPLFLF